MLDRHQGIPRPGLGLAGRFDDDVEGQGDDGGEVASGDDIAACLGRRRLLRGVTDGDPLPLDPGRQIRVDRRLGGEVDGNAQVHQRHPA